MPSLEEPLGKVQSLPQPPPLGFPVPPYRHAVSVQLPTWQDMKGMVAQEPRVLQVQQIGYPRSFLNQDVKKVNAACLTLLGRERENCLMFPSLDHAICCKSMLIDLAPASIDLVRLDAADFLLDESSKTLQNNADPDDDTTLCRRRFFLVFFPAEFTSSAMIFWRTTGTGISSRLGESMHRHLDDIKPAPLTDRIKDTDVLRELVDVDADSLVRSRISDLLNRATINPDKTSRFSAKDVFLYPTGMAAIYETNKLLQLWRSEQQSIVFGFPYELTLKLLEKYGSKVRFYGFGTPEELDDFELYLRNERSLGRQIQSVWCECASNPLLRTVDLERIRRLADEHGFALVMDETIGSFANVDVAGVADIIVTSLTKSFSCNADVMAGSIVINPSSPFHVQLRQALNTTYVNELFAADARVLESNSRQFLYNATIMNRNAAHLVSTLHPYARTPNSSLTHIYYPSICWSRSNYQARMRHTTSDFKPGYGGLFTLEFEDVETASTFFNTLNIHKGPSLGAKVTLAQPYVQTVFSKEKVWAASYGLSETIVRISVGLEDEFALAAEFKRALKLTDQFKARRVKY